MVTDAPSGISTLLLSAVKMALPSRECTLKRTTEVSGTINGLMFRLCEAIGVMINALAPGITIGPPTLRE